MGERTCSIDGCNKPWYYSNGWCKMHYQRWRRHGSLDDPAPRPTLRERLLARSIIRETGCVEWIGGKSANGYGTITEKRKPLLTHRVSYELFVGPIPEDFTIDHLCENKTCIAPAHLEAVPSIVNTRRASKGQFIKTHCKRGHPFDETNTKILPVSERLPYGGRACRQCDRDYQREYQRKVRRLKRERSSLD